MRRVWDAEPVGTRLINNLLKRGDASEASPFLTSAISNTTKIGHENQAYTAHRPGPFGAFTLKNAFADVRRDGQDWMWV